MEKQKKPVIGVCPLYDETKESIWMLPGYLEGLKEAGYPVSDLRERLRSFRS